MSRPHSAAEATLFRFLIGEFDRVLAVFAVDADQALGQNAVQGGDEVVGLDTHVEEATEHVHHVVGVDGGEDKVARKGGVNRDLRGFAAFADFSRPWICLGGRDGG